MTSLFLRVVNGCCEYTFAETAFAPCVVRAVEVVLRLLTEARPVRCTEEADWAFESSLRARRYHAPAHALTAALRALRRCALLPPL